MPWILLFVAGLFEIGWAIGLKYTHGFTRLWPSVGTALSMLVSVVLLGLAMRGSTQRAAKAVLVERVTACDAAGRRSLSTPASSRSKPMRRSSNSRWPAGVSASCRVSRRNSGWPSVSSSPRT